MCGSKGKHLVISSAYHTNISFINDPFSYNILYPSWFTTSYNCSPFMMSVWSYHWRSRYPFVLLPLWEWTYNNPWHILRYYCNYCFREWSTCSKGGFPPFPSPHLTTSGHFYYSKQLLYFDGHCHYWFDSHKCGPININNDIICNDDGCSGKYTILC
jgi:hypothetical protein